MLAHKAEEEGVVAAEVIANKPAHMHYKSIPSVVYTWPEIASVGLTDRQVKDSGRAYRTGKFPFSANGRARSMGESSGFVKFVADEKTDELLGCHMVGPNASELISEIVLAFEYRASADDIDLALSQRGLINANLGFFVNGHQMPVLATLLSTIDLFAIWGWVLAAIGLRITNRLSKGSAWAVVIIIALIGVAFRVVSAFFSGNPS
jgi:hypothetical protein